ncbi:SDR family NAD(P)-dependent oxidoreductase [Aquisediminimonas sediminicola]|uniref:SDR family NAD(P)-dependent oxidoreductase n=1 Tax=Alteraquisediminimonas sediminicola TaxID=2676787 RepID=UPI001C8D6233|nr:SDR family oxidoreductase [Aquisediminimonas sediminicola]
MDLGLSGKKAIVTGSTRGIGRRIVESLLAEGCDVAIGARKADEVEQALGELAGRPGKAVGAAVDVMDGEAYQRWIADMGDKLGGIDIFVHNVSAGGSMDGEASWRNCFEADVLGAVRGVEAATPYLEKSGEASVIFIGTTASVETFMAPMAYNALKASLITYAKQLSQHVGAQGIRVNVVSPGPIYFKGGAWEQIEQGMPELYDTHVALHPTHRMGKPEEIARAVTFLASPAASWINGVNLVVDGGYTKRVQF